MNGFIVIIFIVVLLCGFPYNEYLKNKKLELIKKLEHDKNQREIRHSSYTELCKLTSQSIADNHIRQLSKKAHQLITKDDYGNTNFEDFDKEISYFFEKNVKYKLISLAAETIERQKVYEIVLGTELFLSNYIYDIAWVNANNINENIPNDPFEFEIWCKDIFTDNGYNARLTKKAGDQGVDIIAEKNQVLTVVQCKLYSKPVGNSAVQEIAAARSHENADIAIVVATKGYTKSAISLAKTNDVFLLDAYELSNFLEFNTVI